MMLMLNGTMDGSGCLARRDVVMQEHARMKGDSLEISLKLNVTHNMSSVPNQLDGRKEGVSANLSVQEVVA